MFQKLKMTFYFIMNNIKTSHLELKFMKIKKITQAVYFYPTFLFSQNSFEENLKLQFCYLLFSKINSSIKSNV